MLRNDEEIPKNTKVITLAAQKKGQSANINCGKLIVDLGNYEDDNWGNTDYSVHIIHRKGLYTKKLIKSVRGKSQIATSKFTTYMILPKTKYALCLIVKKSMNGKVLGVWRVHLHKDRTNTIKL